MDALSCSVESRGRATVVNLAGSAGTSTEESLRGFLRGLFTGSAGRVVLNLSKVTFISSVAIGLFVALQREIKVHGGQVTIAGANQDVTQVLTRCKLDTLMPVFPSVDEAMS